MNPHQRAMMLACVLATASLGMVAALPAPAADKIPNIYPGMLSPSYDYGRKYKSRKKKKLFRA